MAHIATNIRQLVNRLEDVRSSEKLDTLQELQKLARAEPKLVGEICVQRLFDFLREQGTAEEYQESLEVIYRLLKAREPSVALHNATVVLADVKNVELLLDLLEHQDVAVGVTASQILTELHSRDAAVLEKQIHDCPAGMNKLLLRLPDKSKEEVRNQAIIFIQQLTEANEEMKKTVVFNEGFEILFGIIESEGGPEESSVVAQDCLSICNNLLFDSETCQRLFFGMGAEWTIKLSEFFSPAHLESPSLGHRQSSLWGSDEEGNKVSLWFDDLNYSRCAFLALNCLAGSLAVVNPKHQQLIGVTLPSVLPSALHWVARRGPAFLLKPAMILLRNAVSKNPVVAAHLLEVVLTINPPIKGRTVPAGLPTLPSLQFGWKPLPTDERHCISVLSLLVERYVYPVSPWSGEISFEAICPDIADCIVPGSTAAMAESISQFDEKDGEAFSQMCLLVLEDILSGDDASTGMVIQYVLAPPPPTPEEEEMSYRGVAMESMKPIGSILLVAVLSVCQKLVEVSSTPGAQLSSALKLDVEVAERCANVLCLIFLHGGKLARELSTALSAAHPSISKPGQSFPNQPILVYLLSSIGRAVRIPLVHSFVTAVFRLLSTAATNCLPATKQMLEDPSNLYVLDLATSVSEAAGVSLCVQTIACLFIGSCFQTLSEQPMSDGADSKEKLTQQSLLAMIDGRIGLTRFTEILRKPFQPSQRSQSGTSMSSVGATHISDALSKELFFSSSYRAFYIDQVEAIRNGIFDFYTGSTNEESSPLMQVIEMQKEKISSLECKVAELEGKSPPVAANLESPEERRQLQEQLTEKSHALFSLEQNWAALTEKANQLRSTISSLELQNQELEQQRQDYDSKLSVLNRELAQNRGHETESNSAREVLALKESILDLDSEKQHLTSLLDQRDKKIALLEEQLLAPVSFNNGREKAEMARKIAGLEGDLKHQEVLLLKYSEVLNDLQLQWTRVVSAVNELTSSTGVECGCSLLVPNFSDLKNAAKIDGAMLSIVESASHMDHRLHACIDAVNLTAGNCSDQSEALGIGLGVLEGEEGTIRRIVSCFENLRLQLSNADSELEAAEQLREQLIQEIEELKKTNSSFSEEQYRDYDDLLFNFRQQEEELATLKQQSEEDISKLAMKLEMTTKELSEFKAERDHALSSALTIGEELMDKRRALDNLSEELGRKSNACAALEAKLSECEKSFADQLFGHQQRANLASDELNVLRLQVAELEKKRDATSHDLESSRRNEAHLQNQLTELQGQLSKLSSSVASSERESKSESPRQAALYSLEVAKLKKQIVDINRDHQIEIEASHQQISDVIARSSTEIEQLRRELQESTTELIEIKSSQSELVNARNEMHDRLAEMQKILDSKEAALLHLSSELKLASTTKDEAAAESQRFASGLNDLTVRFQEKSTEFDQLQHKLSDLTSKYETATRERERMQQEIQRKNDESSLQLAQVERMMSHLQTELELKEAELRSSRELLSEYTSTQEAGTSVEDRLAELNRLLGEHRDEISRLSTDLASVESARGDAVQQIDALRQKLQVTSSERKLAQDRLACLESELADKTAECDGLNLQLKSAVERSSVSVKAETNHLEELQADLDAARCSVHNLELKVLDLESQLNAEVSANKETILMLNNEYSLLEGRLKGKDSALSSLMERTEAMTREELRLTTLVNNLSEQLRQQSQEFEGRTDKMQAENESLLKSREQEAERAIEELRSQTAQQLQTAQGHLNSIERLEMEVSSLKSTVDRQQRELESVRLDRNALREQSSHNSTALAELMSEKNKIADELTVSMSALTSLQLLETELSAQNEELRRQVELSKEEFKKVSNDLQNARTLIESQIHGKAQLAQQQELSRVTVEAAKLFKRTQELERELSTAQDLCRRREGEAAGVRTTLSNLEEELGQLRKENDSLTRKANVEQRSSRELQRELDRLLLNMQLEQQVYDKRQTNGGATVDLERYHKVLLDAVGEFIGELVVWVRALVASSQVSRYQMLHGNSNGASKGSDSGRQNKSFVDPADIRDKAIERLFGVLRLSGEISGPLRAVIGSLGSSFTESLEEWQGILRDQVKLLSENEKEIQELGQKLAVTREQQLLQRSAVSTPNQKARSHGLSQTLQTPVVANFFEGQKTPGSSGSRETSRLHIELTAERRRHHELQEEHSDLLGLLAQQELELTVFKYCLNKIGGSRAVHQAETKAAATVTKKYGCYTNCRSEADYKLLVNDGIVSPS